MYRPSYVLVDDDKLEKNVKNIVSEYCGYKYYFGVVKNNAYHHGMYSVNAIINGGVNYLAVSSLEEAICVRKYNSTIPILCLEPIKVDYIYDAINYNVTLTICNLDNVNEISSLKLKDDIKVHLKVNSGMNRLGFSCKEDFKKAYYLLSNLKHVQIEGVYTHFATSGIKDKFYDIQCAKFAEITSDIDLNSVPIVHADRSLTMVLHDKLSFCNGVRIGISMYGFPQKISQGNFINLIRRKLYNKINHVSEVNFNNNLNLENCLYLYSEVIDVHHIKRGDFVGYGANYIAKSDELIAVIPVGYADGVTIEFSQVYINGNFYQIIAECMDMLVIKIDESVNLHDSVEIIGDHISIKHIANNCNCNAYKVLNNITNRLPIVHKYQENEIEIKY